MSRTPLPQPTPERMSSHYAEAMRRGSPVARKTHDGQYGELTPLRQRGGSRWQSGHPLPYPLSEGHRIFSLTESLAHASGCDLSDKPSQSER
jgi:hypothetical protein